MYVMLVEDEYLLNKAIKTYLTSKGMKVDAYLDGLEAIDAISPQYDVFVFDIDIPNINGIEILEQVHKLYPTLPVIMISATIDIDMITKAYEKGCDDYLKKPFDIKELELKINAFTRNKEKSIEICNNIYYNKDNLELMYDDKTIVLTQKEHLLLTLLISNRGKVVRHEDIETVVWDLDASNTNLRQLVNRLRTKLPKNLIQNRSGEGYLIV